MEESVIGKRKGVEQPTPERKFKPLYIFIFAIVVVAGLLLIGFSILNEMITGRTISEEQFEDMIVANYPFTGNANDISGNENHGILKRDAKISGGILILDGTNDYVNIPNSQELKLNAHTISVWINPEANPTVKMARIVGKGDRESLRNYGLWREEDGDILYQLRGKGYWCNFWKNNKPELNIQADSGWNQIVGVYDGDIGKVYINGEEVYSGTCELAPVVNNDPLQISHKNTKYAYRGKIDNVKIWNYALTSEEVKVDFDASKSQF